jgi:hypothetical protein
LIVGIALTTVGTSANATFGPVGNKMTVKDRGPGVKEKGKPAQPIEKDDEDD